MIGFDRSPSAPQVWAVEDTTAQVTWGNLPAGSVTALSDGGAVTVEHHGGPGAIEVEGLDPGRSSTIGLKWLGGTTTLDVTTLPSPTGEPLTRFATVSDLHLGSRRWGALKTMTEAKAPYAIGSDEPFAYRCAHAAISEAQRWGAELLVIKGDAVQHETPEDFAELGRLVDSASDLPMLLVPGNHDVDKGGDLPTSVGNRGLAYTTGVDWIDLPGVRVIAADTTVPGSGYGSLDRIRTDLIDAVSSAPGPVFIGLHHQLQPGRIPRHWPVGVTAPSSLDFLDELDRLAVPTILSSGHTHRNRSRQFGGVLTTEVASTKDWPGVWAGYRVHEDCIMQVVRRVAAKDAIAWTEYSGGALIGLWARWAPGPMTQRCLSVPVSDRTSLTPSSDNQPAQKPA